MHTDETIVAVASSPRDGYRGIVRVSGPETPECVSRVFASPGTPDWPTTATARRYCGQLCLGPPLGDVPGDLMFWPDQRSYTRQPTAELHTFGAAPLLDAVVRQLCIAGARLARPGEFTLRAFLAGRLDLAQAEGVLGIIDADDRRQLSVALSQLAGGLSRPLTQLRSDLLDLCADLEAGLDFVDEDITFVTTEDVLRRLRAAGEQIESLLDQMTSRSVDGSPPRVVLRGRANAGKSSLWNAMVEGSRAIVAEQAGTTRDYLTGVVRRPDVAFTLVDTAGIETQADDELQRSVRVRAHRQADQADLVLFCIDASRPRDAWELDEWECLCQRDALLVLTKSDQSCQVPLGLIPDVATSVVEKRGIEALIESCATRLHRHQGESRVVTATAIRCRESLRLAHAAVVRARCLCEQQQGDELVSAEVRESLAHLGEVVGAVYTDDLLDRIFSRFCIGK